MHKGIENIDNDVENEERGQLLHNPSLIFKDLKEDLFISIEIVIKKIQDIIQFL